MAGHSKWANIKHRKARQDAKKGKIFTVLIKAITVAAKQGGGNPDDNSRLRLAIDKALAENMTRDTINRAIERGAGGTEADNVEELTYEGYGFGGVAILVEVLTDNRNRTAAEVRHAFTKNNGNLGTHGSVSYLFSKLGQFYYETDKVDELLEIALSLEVDDCEQDNNGISLTTSSENFHQVYTALEDAGFTTEFAEVEMVASTKVHLDAAASSKIINLTYALEELDDVSSVVTNATLTEAT